MWNLAARTTTSDVHPFLPVAYCATSYRACGVVVRIGQRVRGLPRSFVFLTAWNPRSRRMPPGWNRRMQARLVARLLARPLRAEVYPAEGSFRCWREEMLLAGVDPRCALVLARQFRQNAIVLAVPGRRARLLWV